MTFVLSSYAIKTLCKFSKLINALKIRNSTNKYHHKLAVSSIHGILFCMQILQLISRVRTKKKVNKNIAFLRRYTIFMLQEGTVSLFWCFRFDFRWPRALSIMKSYNNTEISFILWESQRKNIKTLPIER